MSKQRAEQRVCALVSAYQEAAVIGRVVRQIKQYVPDVVVVDDGSRDSTAEKAREAGAVVLHHADNMGKGAALQTGFRHVLQQGFDCVICLDGDGQHDPSSIPHFLDIYVRTGIPVLIGNRMTAPAAIPWLQRVSNRFMSWLLSAAMGRYVPDTQCGYRLYRIDVLPFVETLDQHFAAESEILLHLSDRGIRFGAVPITPIYGDETSTSNPVLETWRFLVMLWRYRCCRRWRPSDW